MGFEWQTGDDEEEEWREQRPTYRYRSARWRWLLLGVVALIAAGVITWRLAERRVEASSEQMRDDVRASHELVQRAAAASDVELMRTALSGRDEAWTDTQRELVAEGLAYTGAARLLFLEPVGPPAERSLDLAPNLRSADLVLAQQYTPAAGSPLSAPVVLEQTYTYRRGSNRWLLAPSDETFWGVQRSTRAGRVVVEYPERDEDLARRLADDLAAGVEQLCDLQGCPAELVVTVTFDGDLESLLAFADGAQMLRSGATVSVPAPSLVGIPQDDAGYRALHDAYARYLLSALSPALTRWECCGQALFWQALLQEQLHSLGLAPPLLTSAESITALDLVSDVERFFIDLSQEWQVTRPASLQQPLPLDVRVLVGFLLDQGHTPLQLQLSLSGPTTAFHRWWSSFTAFASTDRQEVRPDLVSFVQAHYEPPPLPADLALPDADLLLVCGVQSDQRIWRYDLHADSWTEELFLEQAELAAVVTDEKRYFVTALQFSEQEEEPFISISIWRVEPGLPAQPVSVAEADGWITLGRHGPVVPAVSFNAMEAGEPAFGIVDLRTCDQAGCAFEQAPGFIVPSPGGDHELASQYFLGMPDLFLRPRGGEWKQLPQQGLAPFWLDDETFAFLEGIETGDMRLVVQTVSGESAVLVDDDSLPPTGEPGPNLLPAGAFYHAPSDTVYLFGSQSGRLVKLLAVPRPAGGSWLVPEPLTPSLVASTEGSPSVSGILPVTYGRWLVLTVAEPQRQQGQLWLVDLAGEVAPLSVAVESDAGILPAHDWNADGDWLAWPTSGALRIMAPAYRDATGEPYQLFIAHEAPGFCSFATWLPR